MSQLLPEAATQTLERLRAAIAEQDYIRAESLQNSLRIAAGTFTSAAELTRIQQELAVLRDQLDQQQAQRAAQLTGLDRKARRSAAYLETGDH